MKTNDERKNEIISKLRSLAELKEEREHIDFELEKAVTMNDNDRYYEAVSARVIRVWYPMILEVGEKNVVKGGNKKEKLDGWNTRN